MPQLKRTMLHLLTELHKMGAEHVCPRAKGREDRFGLMVSPVLSSMASGRSQMSAGQGQHKDVPVLSLAARPWAAQCGQRTNLGCRGLWYPQPHLCNPFWPDSKSLGLLTFSSQHRSKYLPQVKRSLRLGSWLLRGPEGHWDGRQCSELMQEQSRWFRPEVHVAHHPQSDSEQR